MNSGSNARNNPPASAFTNRNCFTGILSDNNMCAQLFISKKTQVGIGVICISNGIYRYLVNKDLRVI
jgi:hypothetical protein